MLTFMQNGLSRTTFMTKMLIMKTRPIFAHHFFRFSALCLLSFGLTACHLPFSDDDDDLAQRWTPNPSCQLHHGLCSLEHKTQQTVQKITLSISPNNPIPVAHLLNAQVTLQNINASMVQIDITGINMYMGYNRTTLIASPDKPNVYTGKIMLAFCTSDKMDWDISVLVMPPKGKLIKAPFLLSTDIN